MAAAWIVLVLAGNVLDLGEANSAYPAFPLRTKGRFIVDANGSRVRLKCVNWYGAHLPQMVANGLDRVGPGQIAKTISESGFNCVRLPFSLDGVIGNFSRVPDPKVSLAACPELQDRSPLEVFDATVDQLTQHGLMVILNNHVSTSMWCCDTSDGEGLWYTKKYPEASWLNALSLMADRYKENPLVMGFDLRNELRPAGNVWPQWGGNESATDWPRAATKAATTILEKNENMLIIISGLYFGIFLCQVPTYPVHSEVPFLKGRVVYTAHEYNWFNFHLVARAGIELYVGLIVAAFPACWLLLCLIRYLGRRGVLQRCSGCPCRRSSNAAAEGSGDWCSESCRSCTTEGSNPCVEFSVAALLATLCAVGLKIIPGFIQRCDITGVYIGVFCAAFTPVCAAVSIFLWTRAAFLALAHREETRASAVLELISLPQAREAGDGNGIGTGSQQLDGCALPQHAQRCRTKRCVLAMILVLMACTLLAVWIEFGKYEAFAKELDFRWGFLQSPSGEAVPVWLGEFGTDVQNLWWKHVLRYIADNEVDFAYWSINGEKYNGIGESFGLFNADFATVQQPWKLEQLQAAMKDATDPAAIITE